MGAGEGRGNFVTGFRSTFDPNAFTRSYQRAQDRAERSKIRTEDVTHRDRVYKLQESDYNLRKEKLKAEQERLRQKDRQEATRRVEDRGLDELEGVMSRLQGKKMYGTMEYINSTPAIRKAYQSGDRAAIAIHTKEIQKRIVDDNERLHKEELELRRAAAFVSNAGNDRQRRFNQVAKMEIADKQTQAIDVNLSNPNARKVSAITSTWIRDKAKQEWAQIAKAALNERKEPPEYNEYMGNFKNAGIGYVLSRTRPRLAAVTQFLLRNQTTGKPVSETAFLREIREGRNPLNFGLSSPFAPSAEMQRDQSALVYLQGVVDSYNKQRTTAE